MSLSSQEKLDVLKSNVSGCVKCPLGKTRNKFVFGEGNPESPLIFIGEGPGKDEDLMGRPFVGRSGQLLTQAIEEIWKKPREEAVYIANIVKCRATVDYKMIKDRAPEKEEVETCLPILIEQLKIIQPKVIITLGASPASALLNQPVSITKLRGSKQNFFGITMIPAFHPSYVLRNGGANGNLWPVFLADLKKGAQLAGVLV